MAFLEVTPFRPASDDPRLETPIEGLGLSARAHKALKEAEIHTVQDVCRTNLVRKPGIGRKHTAEITAAVSRHFGGVRLIHDDRAFTQREDNS